MNLTIDSNIRSPTFWDVATDYIQKPIGFQRMVVLPAIRMFAWTEYFYGTLSETARTAQKTFKHTNHFLFWLQYPERITDFQGAVIKLKNSLKVGSLSEICNESLLTYMHGIFAIDIFADLAKILHRENIITLSGRVLHAVNYTGFLGSTAIVIAGAIGVKNRVNDLKILNWESPKFKWNLIRLVNRISLLAIGIFGAVSFTGMASIPTLATLIASTVLLTTALSAHFYEKLVIAKSEAKMVKLDHGRQSFHGDDESAFKATSP